MRISCAVLSKVLIDNWIELTNNELFDLKGFYGRPWSSLQRRDLFIK